MLKQVPVSQENSSLDPQGPVVTGTRGVPYSLQVFPQVNPQVTHRDLDPCSALVGSKTGTNACRQPFSCL